MKKLLPLLLVSTLATADDSIEREFMYASPPIYPGSSLTPDQKQELVDREQRYEMPIINPRKLDPNLLLVCDPALSPDDIYTGLMAVLVRVEDTLRMHRCPASRFAIHGHPVNVHTLLGKIAGHVTPHLESQPILGTFLNTMQARASQLIEKAKQCQIDYVLMMKIIRITMKLLVNRIMCGYVEIDVLRNRFGWPGKQRSRLGIRSAYLPVTPAAPYYNGPLYPYARAKPFVYPPYPYIPYSNTLQPKIIPAITTKNGAMRPVQKWPYYPTYYAPSDPNIGPLGPDGKQLNGVCTGCKTCNKNKDVIYP